MKDNLLDRLGNDETLKSITIMLMRHIAQNPDLLLDLERTNPVSIEGEEWRKLHTILREEETRTRFGQVVEELANTHDWSRIGEVFVKWGQFGWITDVKLGEIGFWDTLPPTQEKADEKVFAKISDQYLSELRCDIESRTNNIDVFREVCICFDNGCYFACASLLTSLIDGVLTSSYSNGTDKNRRTGEGAEKKIYSELTKNDFFGLPGYFNLELKNFDSFIKTFFARANGFLDEPSNLNRNYLHHGMSNRKVSREDCIKLFVAYRKTIAIAEHDSAKG